MRALLLHDDVATDGPAAAALEADGHEVVRCAMGGGFPCDGALGRCPLDATVDVAVVVHDGPSRALAGSEVGVVCALRDGVPLVVAGANPHADLAARADAVAPTLDALGRSCVAARAAAMARAAGTIERRTGVAADVHRSGDVVRITLPAASTERDAVLVHQAARRLFPAARRIDVGAG